MKTKRILTYVVVLFVTFCSYACESQDEQDSQTSEPSEDVTDQFVKGADVSWLTQMEHEGKKFYTKEGKDSECMSLLKELGTNAIRLRVWVNPSNGWCGKEDVVNKAVRAAKLGMRIMIDFHYSDSWADPSKQFVPQAWKDFSYDEMKKAVSAHTIDVLSALKEADVTPEWVQIGNETSDGMLWDMGKASLNPDLYAGLHNAGYDAAKSVFPNTKVMVHIDNGYDSSRNWLVATLKENGGKFDMIGVSHYPVYAVSEGKFKTWKSCNDKLIANIRTLINTFDADVMVVEFGYAVSEAGDGKKCLQDLMTRCSGIMQCEGVMYWEPQCYDWEHYANGAFSTSGKPTSILDPFKSIYRKTE